MIRLNFWCLLIQFIYFLFSDKPSINGHHNKIARLQTIFNAKDTQHSPHYGPIIHHLSRIVCCPDVYCTYHYGLRPKSELILEPQTLIFFSIKMCIKRHRNIKIWPWELIKMIPNPSKIHPFSKRTGKLLILDFCDDFSHDFSVLNSW